MNLGELIGRYVLTGIILWFATLFLLVIRFVYVGMKSGDARKFLDIFGRNSEVGKKKPITILMIMEYALWPYGLVKWIHSYVQEELKALAEMQEK